MVSTILPVQVGETLSYSNLLDFVDATATTGDYADLGSGLPVIIGDGPFTIAGWMATRRSAWTTDGGEWTIFNSAANSSAQFCHCRADDGSGNEGKLQSSSRDGSGFSGNILTSNVMFLDFKWNCFARVFADGHHFGILNGDVGGMDSNAESKPDFSGHLDFMVGRFALSGGSQNSDYWDGFVFMLGVWRAAWTVEDALKHADGCHPSLIRPNDLVNLWPLSGTGGRDVVGGQTLTPNSNAAGKSYPDVSRLVYPLPVRLEEEILVPAAASAGTVITRLAGEGGLAGITRGLAG